MAPFDVLLQVTVSRKGVWAVNAQERLVPGVRAHVSFQVLSVVECGRAHAALEGLLPRVNPDVLSQVTDETTGVVAQVALVDFFPSTVAGTRLASPRATIHVLFPVSLAVHVKTLWVGMNAPR